MSLPDRVAFCEVGPRDGFQFEDKQIPTGLKVDIINGLADAGLKRIQVTSFVHPEWVPQMADAEALVERLRPRDDVTYTGLALNLQGVKRAHEAGLTHIDLSIATNDDHSRENANMTVEEAIAQAETMAAYVNEHDLQAQLGFQTVFGYRTPGDTPMERVLSMAERFADLGIESLSLADTTGMANPLMIERRVRAVQEVIGDLPLVLHLHDTRGLGLTNVYAALGCGVTWFDTSLAGMGGCPFVHGAAGNIATEDTTYMMQQLGIEVGVDFRKVAACSKRIEAFLGKPFPGKIHRLLQREEKQADI